MAHETRSETMTTTRRTISTTDEDARYIISDGGESGDVTITWQSGETTEEVLDAEDDT